MTIAWQCRRCDAIYGNESGRPKKCEECKSVKFRLIEYPDIDAKPIHDLREKVYYLLLAKNTNQATELLVEYLKNETRFYATRFDENSEIYYYDEGIYKPNGKTFIAEFCRHVLREACTPQIVNKVAFKIEADNYIEQEKLLKRHQPNEIAVENGVVDLQKRTLTEFTPDKIFLTKLPIRFNPDAKCPALESFLADTLPEINDVKTIEELFGYCLQGGYPIQKIALFIGDGGNGKGQVLCLLREFLGENNYSGIPLQKLQDSDFKEYGLFNKLANIGADISDQPLKETAKIKGLSGGDSISASVKFKNDLVFVNEAKLIFSANKLPKTYDLTEGFFRRWIYIVFPFKFLDEQEYNLLPENKREKCKLKKPDIIKKITTPEELSGLLNLSLDGLARLQATGQFTASKTSNETMKWWVRNSDSFLAFCWENLVEVEDGWIGKEDLRKGYGKYCREHKIVSENDKHIHEIMTREMKAWTEQDSDTGGRVWNGVNFKDAVKAKGRVDGLEVEVVRHEKEE